MREYLIAAAFCASPWVSACAADADSPAQSEAQTYVGLVDDSDVRLAIVRDGSAFQAYVCGSGDTLVTHTRWFKSGADGGTVDAMTDGWRLRLGAHPAGSLQGELESPDGELLTWSATLARSGTEEGLYDANHAGCRDGIIVWKAESGPSCKAQGSWCDAQGQRGQVTPVECTADEPLRVEGSVDGKAFELIGERVALP